MAQDLTSVERQDKVENYKLLQRHARSEFNARLSKVLDFKTTTQSQKKSLDSLKEYYLYIEDECKDQNYKDSNTQDFPIFADEAKNFNILIFLIFTELDLKNRMSDYKGIMGNLGLTTIKNERDMITRVNALESFDSIKNFEGQGFNMASYPKAFSYYNQLRNAAEEKAKAAASKIEISAAPVAAPVPQSLTPSEVFSEAVPTVEAPDLFLEALKNRKPLKQTAISPDNKLQPEKEKINPFAGILKPAKERAASKPVVESSSSVSSTTSFAGNPNISKWNKNTSGSNKDNQQSSTASAASIPRMGGTT